MNPAWMWYAARERQEALQREVADERLAREARAHTADEDGGAESGFAGRLVELIWRFGHSGGLPEPTFQGPAEQPVRLDRRWR